MMMKLHEKPLDDDVMILKRITGPLWGESTSNQ